MQLDVKTTETLLERYGIQSPVTDKRFAAHADLQRGTRIDIHCELDPVWGKRLKLKCDRLELSRSCPIEADEAQVLSDQLRQAGLLSQRSQKSKTLEHLLHSASNLYVSEGLDLLHLAVYLRENGYRVANVRMEHSGSLHAKRRLEPGAHDKGAVYAYRPTARQKHAGTTEADA